MRKAAWVTCLVLSACSGGGSSSSSSSSGTPGPLNLHDYLQQASARRCDYEERCATTRGRAYSSRAACGEDFPQTEAVYVAAYDTTLEAFYAAHYVYDEARGRACLAWIEARACSDMSTSNADCQAALVVRTPVARGDICRNDPTSIVALCADATDHCDVSATSDDPACTVCQELKADGAACRASAQCLSGYCAITGTGTAGTCAAPAFKQKGQACQRTEECLGDLACTGATGSMTCEERVGAGGLCETTGPGPRRCYADLQCVTATSSATTGTCTTRLPDGASCSRDPESVQCRNACIYSASSAVTGTCGPLVTLPAAGSPCVSYRQRPLLCELMSGAVYPEVSIVVQGGATTYVGCECRTEVVQGAMCHYTGACADGPCTGGGFDATAGAFREGTCDAPLQNGAACRDLQECESNWCDRTSPASARCAPHPACP